MGDALARRLKQPRPMAHAHEEATVNLLLAAAWLNDRVEQALAEVDLSHAQYNVLRILKGVHPSGHPRGEVACRMIDRAPDVTRLMDRLEERGLVERTRCTEDARRSLSRITRRGLEALARGTEALRPIEREVGKRLGAQAAALSRACEALYGPDV